MGIRFERDSRRATNGPLFFFSILKDETFEEEIRSAFLSGLSFYAYRYPNDSMMCYGSSEGYVEGLELQGFVIGRFSPEKPYITIPYDGVKRKGSEDCMYVMPTRSTTFEEYSMGVTEIIEALEEGRGDKVVSARVEIREEKFDIAEKFYSLCQKFPEAFVFCFGTPATGCWIGASPELLLEGKEKEIRTMALAGTRRAGEEGEWDSKNIEEQKIVADYIGAVFLEKGLEPEFEETYNKVTGKIEHICTPIMARLSKEEKIDLTSLLKSLSPTPALCGTPKEFALSEIRKTEKFDRGCYGGFCGPYHSLNDFTFNVVLRCASLDERKLCIYAGGGITKHSEVEKEWNETEMKIENVWDT